MFWQLLAKTKKFPPAPLLGGGGSKRAKNRVFGHFRPIFCPNGAFEGKMDGAIGFSGEKSTGKVILEPMAKTLLHCVIYSSIYIPRQYGKC